MADSDMLNIRLNINVQKYNTTTKINAVLMP